ncbi:MAG TPA: septum site-determining protein MinC, partial [Gammaproteobacteria bacterium]|nr:septum site-determining protein MinC [Gammaproteobacteria bacterium]
ETEIDFTELTALLREYGMIPLAVRGAAEKDKQRIVEAGLAHFNELKEGENDKSVAVEKPKLALPAANDASITEASIRPTKIVNQRVRSGQQVTASGSDLIIVGAVSEGAELKADGNVHIYGNLRGRVQAGGQGNKDARIFCHELRAQFVSIAGVHAVSDSFPQELWGQAAQIYLSNGKLIVEPI